MKRLLLLHTGGTLGMAVPAAGALKPEGPLAGVFQYIPEALELADIETQALFNMDSADMHSRHWEGMARAIEENLDRYDGFVIIHGTDTMAYSAAALSYMLVNLPKPVILTGAQRPIAMIRTDARSNLVNALELATKDIPEVGLFFNHRLFRGNRASKVSIDEFDAFMSPNYPALAEVGLHLEIRQDAIRRPAGLFQVQSGFSDEVLTIRLVPGMNPRHLEPLLDGPVRAFVFEAFGAGNVPSQDPSLIPFIERATEREKLVAVCSQALSGAVDLELYESAQLAASAGALSCRDMTTEAAVVKLMFLLGQFEGDTSKVRRNWDVSLAGEMS